MSEQIVPQAELEVKRCNDQYCDEDVFRNSPLCLEHFVEIETAAWDDRDAERGMVLETVGYVFGDMVGEVCQ